MEKMKLVNFIPLLGVILIVISGCFSEEVVEPKKLEDVKVQLKWVHQAQFAGNYVAKEKGLYEKYGINIVSMEPFDFVNWPIDRVQNKEVEFGITGGDELTLARTTGKAEKVKAIAVIYKINPVVLYSLKSSDIKKPEDLMGKTVGIERAPDGTEVNVGILYKAMLAKLGIKASEINEVTIGYDATELLAGETDVSSGYITNEPHQVIEAGYEVNTILVADYGVNMYADVIIVHEDTINNNPDLVENFLRATLEGWQYSIENNDKAIDIVLKYAKDRTREHETYMLKKSIPLIHTGRDHIGVMEKSEWDQAKDILLEQNIIESSIDVEEIYNMEFLDRIYDLN